MADPRPAGDVALDELEAAGLWSPTGEARPDASGLKVPLTGASGLRPQPKAPPAVAPPVPVPPPQAPVQAPTPVPVPSALPPQGQFFTVPLEARQVDTPAGKANLRIDPGDARTLENTKRVGDPASRLETAARVTSGDPYVTTAEAEREKASSWGPLDALATALEPFDVPRRLYWHTWAWVGEKLPDEGPVADALRELVATEVEFGTKAAEWAHEPFMRAGMLEVAGMARATEAVRGDETAGKLADTLTDWATKAPEARADEDQYERSLHEAGRSLYDALASGKLLDESTKQSESAWILLGMDTPNLSGADVLDAALPKERAARMAEASGSMSEGRPGARTMWEGLQTDTGRLVYGAAFEMALDPLNVMGIPAGTKAISVGDDLIRVAPTVLRAGEAVNTASKLEGLAGTRAIVKAMQQGGDALPKLLTDAAVELQIRLDRARTVLAEARLWAERPADALALARKAGDDLEAAGASAELVADTRRWAATLGDSPVSAGQRVDLLVQRIRQEVSSLERAQSAVDTLRRFDGRAFGTAGLVQSGTLPGMFSLSVPFSERSVSIWPLVRPMVRPLGRVATAAKAKTPAALARKVATVDPARILDVLGPGDALLYSFYKLGDHLPTVGPAVAAAKQVPGWVYDLGEAGWNVLARMLGPRTFAPAVVDMGKASPLHDVSDATKLPGEAMLGSDRWRRVARPVRQVWDAYHAAVGRFMAMMDARGTEIARAVRRVLKRAEEVASAAGQKTQEVFDDAVDAVERGYGLLEGELAHLKPLVDDYRKLVVDVSNTLGVPLDAVKQALVAIHRKARGTPEVFQALNDALNAADDVFRHLRTTFGGVWGEAFDRTMTRWFAATKALGDAMSAATPEAFIDALRAAEEAGRGRALAPAERLAFAREVLTTATGSPKAAQRVLTALAAGLGCKPEDALGTLLKLVEARAAPGNVELDAAFRKVLAELQEEADAARLVLAGTVPTPAMLTALSRALTAKGYNNLATARSIVGDTDWAAFVAWATAGGTGPIPGGVTVARGKAVTVSVKATNRAANLAFAKRTIANGIDAEEIERWILSELPKVPVRGRHGATEGVAATAVLKKLIATTKIPEHKLIAKKLLETIEDDVVVAIDDAMAGHAGARAYYTYFDRMVVLRSLDSAAQTGVQERTLLHELTHAATVAALHDAKAVGDKLDAQNEVTRLLQLIRDAVTDPARRKAIGWETLSRFDYYTTNRDELMVGCFSDPEFRSFLATVDASAMPDAAPASIWTKFVRSVAKLLGIKADDTTALARLLGATSALADTKTRWADLGSTTGTWHELGDMMPDRGTDWAAALAYWNRAKPSLQAAIAAADAAKTAGAGANLEGGLRVFLTGLRSQAERTLKTTVGKDRLGPTAQAVLGRAAQIEAEAGGTAGTSGAAIATTVDAAWKAHTKARDAAAAKLMEARPHLPNVPGELVTADGKVQGRTLEAWEGELWARARKLTAGMPELDVVRAALGVLADVAELPKDIPDAEGLKGMYGEVLGRRLGELRPDLAPVVAELRGILDRYETLYRESGIVRVKNPLEMAKDWGVLGYVPHIEDAKSLTARGKLSGALALLGEATGPSEGSAVEDILSTALDQRMKRLIAGTVREINAAANASAIRMTNDPMLILARLAQANRAIGAQELLVSLLKSRVIVSAIGGVPPAGYVPIFRRGEFERTWDVLIRGTNGELLDAGIDANTAAAMLAKLRAGKLKGGFGTWLRSIPEIQQVEDIDEMLLSIRLAGLDNSEVLTRLDDVVESGTKGRKTWEQVTTEFNALAVDAGSDRRTSPAMLQRYFRPEGAPTFYVPAAVAQSLDDLFDLESWIPAGFAGGAKRVLDAISRFYKARVTAINPAFNTRNAIYNQLVNVIDLGTGAFSPKHQYLASRLVAAAHFVEEYGSLAKAQAALTAPQRAGESAVAWATRRAQHAAAWVPHALDELVSNGVDLGDGVIRPVDDAVRDLAERGVLSGAYTAFADLSVLQNDLADILATGGSEEVLQRMSRLASQAEDLGLMVLTSMVTGGVPVVLPKRWGSAIANALENQSRVLNFLGNMRRSGSWDASVDAVGKNLFNYSDLNAFQKVWARTVIPFWTWPSKNMWLHLDYLLDRPAIFAQYHNLLFDNGADIAETWAAESDGEAWTGIPSNDPSKLVYREPNAKRVARIAVPGIRGGYISGFGTPLEAAFDWGSNVSNLLRPSKWKAFFDVDSEDRDLLKGLAVTHFGFVIALELLAKQNFYFNRPLSELSNARPIAQLVAGLRRWSDLPVIGPAADTMAGLLASAARLSITQVPDKRTGGMREQITASPMANYLVGKSPWSRPLLNAAAASDAYHLSVYQNRDMDLGTPDVEPLPAWLRYLDAFTAISTIQEDPAYQQKSHERDVLEAVERNTTTRGVTSTYENTTIPR